MTRPGSSFPGLTCTDRVFSFPECMVQNVSGNRQSAMWNRFLKGITWKAALVVSAVAVLCLLIGIVLIVQGFVPVTKRSAAEKAFAEAGRLQEECSVESQRKALVKYEEARSAWVALGNLKTQDAALRKIGEIHFLSGNPQAALPPLEESLRLCQQTGDRNGESETLNHLSSVYLLSGDLQKAAATCNKALELSRSSGNRRGEAQAFNNLGETYYWSGNLRQALASYQQALPIWVALDDRRGQAQTLLFFGCTFSDQGEPQKAFEYFNQALSLWQLTGNCRGLASVLTGLGRLYSRTGESQKAIDHFNQAVRLTRLSGDLIEEASTLNGIGYVQESLGGKEKALEHYNQALALFQSAHSAKGEASTLLEIGRVQDLLGNHQEALASFQRCLSLSQVSHDQRLVSYARRQIGMIHDAQEDKTTALEYYRLSLSDQERTDRRGDALTLNLIGQVYQSRNKIQQALKYYYEALKFNRAAEDGIREAQTLYNIANAENDRGRLTVALTQIRESISTIESLRFRVSSQNLRSSYFASIHESFELYIKLLMKAHRHRPSTRLEAEALQVAEQARARTLLELLSESKADIRHGVNPDLTERTRSLRQQLNAKAEHKIQLLNNPAAKEEVVTVTKEIDKLTVEIDRAEAVIRIESPHYAALTQPQPLALSEIQQLLSDDTLLLEYSTGSERSYLWAVTRTGLKSYELPGHRIIEDQALKVYKLLSEKNTDAAQTDKQREQAYWTSASELSRNILKPLADFPDKKRLVIVADGVLQYIPFAALPGPDHTERRRGKEGLGRSADFISPEPLISKYSISYLPSASSLAVLRRETAGRPPAPGTIVVLADPVYEADDLRVIGSAIQNKAATSNQTASNNQATRDGLSLQRLSSTEYEARAIEEITEPAARLVARGFEADRALALSPELSRYRIIHFATHGWLDRKNPEFSAIVLSSVDRQGKPQDGYLRLGDIYNLKLNADLVVLSACETGLGQEIKGEGLVGLTRGFMYAGAPRVMASLWNVNDRSTAHLMRQFYHYLLRDCLPPAEALRKAQLDLSKDASWHAPWNWAPFVLQGEWK